MIKKAALTVLLLSMVVGVSYIKAVRQEEKVDRSFQLGQRAGPHKMISIQKADDSINTRQTVEKEIQLDSLKSQIEVKDENISELYGKKISDTNKLHKELIAFYMKRYETLPRNLSDDEFSVAVTNLRKETADKFSISVVELNKLREKYKINY